MPAGVAVEVADGFATIDFVDPTKRGVGLAALIAVGGSEVIEKLTRSGPRVLYRVPEGNARAAGLLDKKSEPIAVVDTSSGADATGCVPPEGPSVTELFAQEVRSGDFADAYSGVTGAAGQPLIVEGYDDGLPDGDWSRAALNKWAVEHGISDPDHLPNKAAVLAAIRARPV